MLVLETARLSIRTLTAADVPALYALTSDPRVMAMVGNGQVLSYERTERWIRMAMQDHKTRGWSTWATVDKADRTLLGWSGFVALADSSEIEMVYGFAPAHWGKGLASELAEALLEYGFSSLAFPRIWATIDPEYQASTRIVQKLGMRLVRSDADESGLPTDFYVLEKTEWLSR